MESRSQASQFWFSIEHELLPLLKGIGENLIGWILIAFLFIIVLSYIQKKKEWKKGMKVSLTLITTTLLLVVVYIIHFIVFFGEAFEGGVSKTRWPVMLTMSLVTGVFFTVLNLSNRKAESVGSGNT